MFNVKNGFEIFEFSVIPRSMIGNRKVSTFKRCQLTLWQSQFGRGGVYFYWAQTFINNVCLRSGPSLLIKTVKLLRRRENDWMKRRVNETRRIMRSSAFKVGIVLIVQTYALFLCASVILVTVTKPLRDISRETSWICRTI